MIKDITIGQHFPGNSPLHRMDPRSKLILTLAYIVMIFVSQNTLSILVSFAFLLFCYLISRIPLKMLVKSIKPILPIVLFTAILNIFFIDGRVLVQWWIFKITEEGVRMAVLLAVRIILLIAGSSLLTYTTSPIALTDGLERLMSPLKRFHFPAHELAMMMTIALRFIPTLIEETDKIMSAQKARGADMDSGGLIKRVKSLIPILIPLFVSAFRRADELAVAMECRCYRGGDGRTRMRQLHFCAVDIWAAIFMALCIAGIILCNIFAPAVLL